VRPNCLMFVADAMRYDYCCQHATYVSKVFAAKGWWFEGQYSVANSSDPNFIAMLGGLQPDDTGVYATAGFLTRHIGEVEGSSTIVPEGEQYDQIKSKWLPHLLSKQGYHVVIVGEDYIDLYRHGAHEFRRLTYWGDCQEVIKDLQLPSDKPWFCFIRSLDTHYPYYGGSPQEAAKHTSMVFKRLVDRYDLSNTYVIFTSDHGDTIGEREDFHRFHDFGVWQEVVHIPLVVVGPGIDRRVIPFTEFHNHLDLYSLLCDILLQGKHPRMSTPRKELEFVGKGWCSSTYHQWEFRSLYRPPWWFISGKHYHGYHITLLYNVNNDPKQLVHVGADQGHRVIEILREIQSRHAGWPQQGLVPWFKCIEETDHPEVITRLQALGYME